MDLFLEQHLSIFTALGLIGWILVLSPALIVAGLLSVFGMPAVLMGIWAIFDTVLLPNMLVLSAGNILLIVVVYALMARPLGRYYRSRIAPLSRSARI